SHPPVSVRERHPAPFPFSFGPPSGHGRDTRGTSAAPRTPDRELAPCSERYGAAPKRLRPGAILPRRHSRGKRAMHYPRLLSFPNIKFAAEKKLLPFHARNSSAAVSHSETSQKRTGPLDTENGSGASRGMMIY